MSALPGLRRPHLLTSHCLARARHVDLTQEHVANRNVLSWNDIKFNLVLQSLPQYTYCCQSSFKKYVMGANYVLDTILSTGDRMENKIIPPLRRLLLSNM